MATKLYFHAALVDNIQSLPAAKQSTLTKNKGVDAETVNRKMDTTIGLAQTSLVLTSIGSVSAQNYYFTKFVSPPLNQSTIAANSWTYAFATLEGNTNANFPAGATPASVYACLYVWRPSTGSVVASIYDAAGDSGTGYRESLTSGGRTQTGTFSGAAVSSGILVGDVLVFEVWFQITQSNANAQTDTFYYDGTTEASATNCASFISTPETLAFATTSDTSAINFTKTSLHYVDCTNNTALAQGQTSGSEVSWACWFRAAAAPASAAAMLSKGSGIFLPYMNTLGHVTINTRYHDATSVQPGNTVNLGDSTWHHLVATHSNIANYTRHYLDGVEFYNNSKSDYLASSSTASFFIGADTGPTNYFNGQIDEVRIYNVQLTPDEVKRLAGGDVTVGRGLVVRFKLDENTGTSTTDSISSIVGTLTNGAAWYTTLLPYLFAEATRVTGANTLKYNIRKLVTNSKTLKYNLRKLIATNRTLKYNLRKLVTRSNTLLYDILAAISLTRVLNSNTLLYNVRQQVKHSNTLKYSIIRRILHANTIKYNLRKQVKSSRTLEYSILSRIVHANILKYNLRYLIKSSNTLKYDLRKLVVSSRTVKYNLRISVISSRILKYSLLVSVLKPNELKYSILEQIKHANTLKYNLRKQIVHPITLKWNIIADFRRVANALILKYNIRQQVKHSNTLVYSIIDKFRILRANTLRYSILQQVKHQNTLKYNLHQRIVSVRALRYNLRARVSFPVTLSYSILKLVKQPNRIRYNIRKLAATTKILRYRIRQRQQAQQTLIYNIFGTPAPRYRVTVSLSLKYNLRKQVKHRITLIWEIYPYWWLMPRFDKVLETFIRNNYADDKNVINPPKSSISWGKVWDGMGANTRTVLKCIQMPTKLTQLDPPQKVRLESTPVLIKITHRDLENSRAPLLQNMENYIINMLWNNTTSDQIKSTGINHILPASYNYIDVDIGVFELDIIVNVFFFRKIPA